MLKFKEMRSILNERIEVNLHLPLSSAIVRCLPLSHPHLAGGESSLPSPPLYFFFFFNLLRC
jgi:hypothetical protein